MSLCTPLVFVTLLHPHHDAVRDALVFYFTDGKAEAQGGCVSCSQSCGGSKGRGWPRSCETAAGLASSRVTREHSSFCSVSCPLRRKSLLWEGMLCGPEGERHGEGNAGCPYTATALVPEKNKLVQIKVWAAGIACCVRFLLQGAWREAPVCRALSGRG